jgi:RES domain
MSAVLRGPDGAAPLPPDWLDKVSLPIISVPPQTDLYRVHDKNRGPVFFGPGAGKPPAYRFDPASGAFGVLYVAPQAEAAIIETLLRNPQRLTVDYKAIETRALSILKTKRDIRLVQATGDGLSKIGTTAALSTGPYEPCAQWSDALYQHPDAPDGILFASRHNPETHCVALFERTDYDLEIYETMLLTDILVEVGALLDRHGKSIFGLS